MAVTTKDALNKLKSHLKRCAYLGKVEFGDPMEPPNDFDAFIVLVRFEPKAGEESTLTGTIERRVVAIRVYTRLLAETTAGMELKRDEIAVKLHEDIMGDYTLGDTVRQVEFPTTVFTHDMIKEVGYKVIEITLPLIVDDSAALAP